MLLCKTICLQQEPRHSHRERLQLRSGSSERQPGCVQERRVMAGAGGGLGVGVHNQAVATSTQHQ
jgi:hypothetical protein